MNEPSPPAGPAPQVSSAILSLDLKVLIFMLDVILCQPNMHENQNPPKTRPNHTARLLVKLSTGINTFRLWASLFMSSLFVILMIRRPCFTKMKPSTVHEFPSQTTFCTSFNNFILSFVRLSVTLIPMPLGFLLVVRPCKYSFPDSVTAELHYYWTRL